MSDEKVDKTVKTFFTKRMVSIKRIDENLGFSIFNYLSIGCTIGLSYPVSLKDLYKQKSECESYSYEFLDIVDCKNFRSENCLGCKGKLLLKCIDYEPDILYEVCAFIGRNWQETKTTVAWIKSPYFDVLNGFEITQKEFSL